MHDGLPTGRRGDRFDAALTQVLVDPARVVEEPERPLEPMDDVTTLCCVKALVVDTEDVVHNADVSGLRQERPVIDERPWCQEAVHAAGGVIVLEDPTDFQHGRTSMSARMCFAASKRGFTRDDASRMRSMCGSRVVAVRANRYSAANIRRPARNE